MENKKPEEKTNCYILRRLNLENFEKNFNSSKDIYEYFRNEQFVFFVPFEISETLVCHDLFLEKIFEK